MHRQASDLASLSAAPAAGTFRATDGAELFYRHVSREHDLRVENMIVLGHSVAAVMIATWVHDYAPAVRAMILATPAFRVKLYVLAIDRYGIFTVSVSRKAAP